MTTYYIRQGGLAANKGAATGPGSTAANCMAPSVHNAETFSPGDILSLCADGGTIVEDELVPPSSGTAESPIIYRVETGDAVVIDGEGSGTPVIDFDAVSYVEVYGYDSDGNGSLTLTCANDHVVVFDGAVGCVVDRLIAHAGGWAGIMVWDETGNDCHDNIIMNCEVYNTPHEGIYCKNETGTGTYDNTFIGNYVHDVADECFQNSHDIVPANAPTGTIVQDCIFEGHSDTSACQLMNDVLIERCEFSGAGDGLWGVIFLDGGSGAIVRNNLIKTTALANASDAAGIYLGETTDAQVYHNTVSGITNSGAGTGLGILQTSGATGAVIQHNILAGCTDQMRFDGTPTLASYNCVFGSASDTGSNAITSDPQFLNAGTDFHLQSDSPCISAAVGSTLDLDKDKSPRLRGAVNDIGAFETLKGGPRSL